MLTYMDSNSDVWRGWTYWAGGAWWGDYPLSVQPGDDGKPRPQMTVLVRHAIR
jgi:endoglucanase